MVVKKILTLICDMRRNICLLLIAVLPFAIISCTNDSGMDPGGHSALTLSASIGTASASASERFSQGDEVTILINGKAYEHPYTILSNGMLSSDDPYYFQSTDPVKVQGIYPAIGSIQNNSFTWEVETNQSMEEDYEGSDLLVSPVMDVSVKDPSNTSMTFHHQAAKIIVNVSFYDSDFTYQIDPDDISMTIKNVSTNGTFSLPAEGDKTGEWTQTGGTGNVTPYSVDSAAGYAASFEAIVIPQNISADKTLFEFKVGEYGPFYYSVPSSGIEWKAGYEYTYNVTIKATNLKSR